MGFFDDPADVVEPVLHRFKSTAKQLKLLAMTHKK